MIELDAWELSDIRDLLADKTKTYGSVRDWQDCEILDLADHIYDICSLHTARAVRASMQAGLSRIPSREAK